MDQILSLIGDWAEASPRNLKLTILLMVVLFPVTLSLLVYRIVTMGWIFLVWRHRVERVPNFQRRSS